MGSYSVNYAGIALKLRNFRRPIENGSKETMHNNSSKHHVNSPPIDRMIIQQGPLTKPNKNNLIDPKKPQQRPKPKQIQHRHSSPEQQGKVHDGQQCGIDVLDLEGVVF